MIREYIIKISDEVMENEIADSPKELVRCKDCKHGEQSVLPNRHLWCRIHEFYREPDWFCADGERQEGR